MTYVNGRMYFVHHDIPLTHTHSKQYCIIFLWSHTSVLLEGHIQTGNTGHDWGESLIGVVNMKTSALFFVFST